MIKTVLELTPDQAAVVCDPERGLVLVPASGSSDDAAAASIVARALFLVGSDPTGQLCSEDALIVVLRADGADDNDVNALVAGYAADPANTNSRIASERNRGAGI